MKNSRGLTSTLLWLSAMLLTACGTLPMGADVADGASNTDATPADANSGDSVSTDAATDSPTAPTDAPTTRVPNIRMAVGNCGGTARNPGMYPNQLSPGDTLRRLTLRAPEAVCNDGTPAVLYVRAATNPANRDRWVMHLQGGSSCTSYEECRIRWCGEDYYDASKMSSAFAPASIMGVGIHAANSGNALADANHVYFYYCSSDSWTGRSVSVLTDTADPNRQYSLHRRGHSIIESAFASLRAGARSDDGAESMPTLTSATEVIWSGTSAGSVGAQHHLDWVAAQFNASQTRVVGYFDAAMPLSRNVLTPALLTTIDARVQANWTLRTSQELAPPFVDASCEAALSSPQDTWRCSQTSHLTFHHITTPFFARMDLTDSLAVENWMEMGVSRAEFAAATAASLTELRGIQNTATERAAITRAPVVFGPNCGQHVGIESSRVYYLTGINNAGALVSPYSAFVSYLQGNDSSLIDTVMGTNSVCMADPQR